MTNPTDEQSLDEVVSSFERGDFSKLSELESSSRSDLLAAARVGRLLATQYERWNRREEALQILGEAMMSVAAGDFGIDPNLDSGDDMLDSIMLALGMTAQELDGTYRELEETRDEAVRASEIKSQFLASMSHEFRTPLNAIIGYSELIQEDAEDAGLDQFHEDSSRVLQASRHLLSLISDVLDLSKIEAGRIELDPEVFEVEELCQELHTVLKPLSQSRGNDFQVSIEEGLGAVYNDRMRLHQILLNLLSNANKFTKEGVVRFSVRREHDEIVFDVQDSGIGISQERIERIFDPFTQEDSSTTRRFGGTGLGLSISKELIELLGGRISAESTVGEGSCFTVRLPITQVTSNVSTPVALPTGLARISEVARNVVIIDDDPHVHELLSRSLPEEDYSLVGFSNGIDALESMEANPPDIILLDICLPKIDGWEVLRRLRASTKLANVPVIIISIVDDRVTGIELGADEHMTKPLNYERLGQVMENLCSSPQGTILVVDDDSNARDLARRSLEPNGYHVIEASDGLDALNALKESTPDVILLDLMMPHMDGFELHEYIQSEQDLQHIPTIILSAKQLTPGEYDSLSSSEHILEKAGMPYGKLSKLIGQLVRPS